jgi:DNA-binding NarL/FixJ family response regulator
MNSGQDALIVCGEPLSRIGLNYLLTVEAGLHVLRETADPADALQFCVELRPSLVVVDFVLPHGDGLVLIQHLRRFVPSTPVLVVSSQEDSQSVQRAFRAGARGFVTKRDDTKELLHAIHMVRKGHRYASSRIASLLLTELSQGTMKSRRDADIAQLSNRELQVFRLIGHGTRTAAIAKQLCVSVKTVETHRQRIKEKLKLQNGALLNLRASHWAAQDAQRTPATRGAGLPASQRS